jgi:hypothetical protein
MNPAAFTIDFKTTLWVMDDKVAVFNLKHAEIVFSYILPNLQVYGIKRTTANLLLSYAQAVEFFSEAE